MKKKTRVIGFGTFDGLHPGHWHFLRQLKKLGDELVVVVARDSNVKKIKGKKPRQNEEARRRALELSGLADRVEMGNPHDFYQCLRDHRPDLIGLGYDQEADLQSISKILPSVKIIRLKPFRAHRYKSSLLALPR